MTEEAEHRCGTCMYCERVGGTDALTTGRCRRMPPTATMHMSAKGPVNMTGYAMVRLTDWGCWEWKAEESANQI